ncbi:MAG: hypothetical protein Kow00103_12410 [Candidatus Caldatribacteriota bacterium]
MDYKETVKIMLDHGLLKEQRIDFKQIEALLYRAQKDLFVSRVNLEFDEEATYTYAYLAMLRCGRAIIYMKNYRPADGQQHKTVIELAGKILGKGFNDIINKFDSMRRKRNQFTYDPSMPVSKFEAENALKTSEEFVEKIIEIVKKENPQQKFNF